MTTTHQISRMIRQGVKAVAETFDRICDLADFIIRINEIENCKRMGSSESIEAFRNELDRFTSRSTSAKRCEQEFTNWLDFRDQRASRYQGDCQMGQTVEQFGARCRDILKRNPGSEGVEQVRRNLEEVLADEDFLAAHLGPDEDSDRKIIYEDPELKFCILAHVFTGSNESAPHDHGPTWAIYGQATGTTEMTEYQVIQAPEGEKPGKVEPCKTYQMTPGMAVAYDVGQVHSPKREGDTRLIRIEGRNVRTVKRTPLELA